VAGLRSDLDSVKRGITGKHGTKIHGTLCESNEVYGGSHVLFDTLFIARGFADVGEQWRKSCWFVDRGTKIFWRHSDGRDDKKSDLPIFANTKDWLDRYFAGQKPSISDLPLAPGGGAFRTAVWNILCEIPYGTVTTYGEMAKRVAARLNKPRMSSQAVGGAVGHNPISIIIPCHRVVGSNGSLTGYAGGIDKKIRLLEHENVDMSRLFTPACGTAL
jgi:methylated-DNA-[protein]-cysteine S-methyltransferase